MQVNIYVWKENQEQLSGIANKQELINKLLRAYFDGKAAKKNV